MIVVNNLENAMIRRTQKMLIKLFTAAGVIAMASNGYAEPAP